MFKFIWGGKRDQIKRKIMMNYTSFGGLQVPHLNSYIESINISWVKRLNDKTNKASWKILAKHFIEAPDDIWKYNFSSKNRIIKKFTNIFWKEVVIAWSKINFKNNVNSYKDICSQYIWYNDNILINKKAVYLENWQRKGVNKISHMYTKRGKIMSYEEFIQKWNVHTDFLVYFSIVKAIPRNWKDIIKNNSTGTSTLTELHTLEKLELLDKISKFAYSKIIQQYVERPVRILLKWESELNTNQINEDCEIYFNLIYQATVSTKLRAFQFKFLHRCFKTINLLEKIGIVKTNKCYLCDLEVENMPHLFWSCTISAIFWQKIIKWLKNLTKIAEFSRKEIMLGCIGTETGYIT